MVRSRAKRGVSNHPSRRRCAPPQDEGRTQGCVLMVRSRAKRGVSNHPSRRRYAPPQDEVRGFGFRRSNPIGLIESIRYSLTGCPA
jgi:hypothetical protein